MNNEQNERIKLCRYYRGNDTRPWDNPEDTFWWIECLWLERKPEDEASFGLKDDYIKAGLKDFEANDGTPLGVKLMLFAYAAKHCSGGRLDRADEFKEIYKIYIENAPYKQGE